jgi:hypothetical protein
VLEEQKESGEEIMKSEMIETVEEELKIKPPKV